MNNLVQNYKIILEELTKTCSHIESFTQIRQPKLSNLELVALTLTSEYMSYNSELQLFRAISNTELEAKIERSVFNKSRRTLKLYIEQVRQCLSRKFFHLDNLFIIDSVPIEICRMSRAKRSNTLNSQEFSR